MTTTTRPFTAHEAFMLDLTVYWTKTSIKLLFVAAPSRDWAARCFGETQGFHGFDHARATMAISPTTQDDWQHVWEAAIKHPLDLLYIDRPSFGLKTDFVPRWYTRNAQQLAGTTYEAAENDWRRGGLTQSQWDAYRYVWRTSAPRMSNVGSGPDPTDPFILAYASVLEAFVELRKEKTGR